jgi:hypothetical protein
MQAAVAEVQQAVGQLARAEQAAVEQVVYKRLALLVL